MPPQQYLSTDPNAGTPVAAKPPANYLSTDPNAGTPNAPAPQPPRTWGQTAQDVGTGILKGAAHGAIDVGQAIVSGGLAPTPWNANTATLDAMRAATPYTNTAQKVGGAIETAAELAPGAIGVARAVPGLAREALSSPAAGDVVEALANNPTGLVTQLRQALSKKLAGAVVDWAKTPPAQRAADTTIADTVQELQKVAPAPAVATPTAAPRPYFLKPEAQMAPVAGPSATPQQLPQAWQQFAKPANFPPTDIEGSHLAVAFDQKLAEEGVKASDVIPQVLRNKDIPATMRQQMVSALEKVARKQAGVSVPSMTEPTLPASWQALVQK